MKYSSADLYKIIIRFRYVTIFTAVFLLCFTAASAQDTILNKYGLWVIGSPSDYATILKKNPSKKMTDIKKIIPGIILDLKYTGADNFMKKALYPMTKTTYLRAEAAKALADVQKQLNGKGLGLKIWDAYRPYSVTEKMWEPVKDERYAADPKFGSGHNRGIAVDLTIIDLKTKKELDMGTGFDNFSDTAHHNFTKLNATVLSNRILLRSVMEKYGFKALESEWWHYFLPDGKRYELMDLSFAQLAVLNK